MNIFERNGWEIIGETEANEFMYARRAGKGWEYLNVKWIYHSPPVKYFLRDGALITYIEKTKTPNQKLGVGNANK